MSVRVQKHIFAIFLTLVAATFTYADEVDKTVAAPVIPNDQITPDRFSSDVKGEEIEITLTKNELKIPRTQIDLRISQYQDQANNKGLSVNAGFVRPLYLVGGHSNNSSIGLLIPALSGTDGQLDYNFNTHTIDGYKLNITGTGIRIQGTIRAFSEFEANKDIYIKGQDLYPDPDGYDHPDFNTFKYDSKNPKVIERYKLEKEKAVKSREQEKARAEILLKETKQKLEAEGWDTSDLRIKLSATYGITGTVRLKHNPATTTADIVFAPTNLVIENNDRTSFEEHGVRIGVANASTHVAFKLNGFPIDLCAHLKLIQAVHSTDRAADFGGRIQKVGGTFHPIEGNACIGTRLKLPVIGSMYISDEAAVEWARATKTVTSRDEQNYPISDFQSVNKALFSNTVSVERALKNRRIGLFYKYEYDYERQEGRSDVSSDTPTWSDVEENHTHLIGISIK